MFDLLLLLLLQMEWMNGSQKGKVSESRREIPNPELRRNFVAAYLEAHALETLFLESALASHAVCVCVWFPWKRESVWHTGWTPQDQPKFSFPWQMKPRIDSVSPRINESEIQSTSHFCFWFYIFKAGERWLLVASPVLRKHPLLIFVIGQTCTAYSSAVNTPWHVCVDRLPCI